VSGCNLLHHQLLTVKYVAAFLRSVVVDGVTLGHPCCGVHDCKDPLESLKDHFCPEHMADFSSKCAVDDCDNKVSSGFRTCDISEHRALEEWLVEENKAMFQLRRRLARLAPGAMQPDDPLSMDPLNDADAGIAGSSSHTAEQVEVDETGICSGKPEKGNRRLKARFGRRRTHNEELCVTSCGVILGRATFYGSEAPNGVRVSPIGSSFASW
jgi:CxC6 like cysteine cluster associated with KDZ transposases